MKNSIVYLFLTLCCCIGCTPKPYLVESYVRPVTTSVSQSGVLYLEANGYHKRKTEAKQEAMRNALRAVIFDGVSNSSVKRPLVSEPGARSKYATYFDRFFAEGGRYADFVRVNQVDPTRTVRVGKGYQLAVQVEVNYLALQRELQASGIIERFGI